MNENLLQYFREVSDIKTAKQELYLRSAFRIPRFVFRILYFVFRVKRSAFSVPRSQRYLKLFRNSSL